MLPGNINNFEVVCFPSKKFDLLLYTNHNTTEKITVNVNIYDPLSCAQYDANINLPIISSVVSNNSGIYSDGDEINLTVTSNATGQNLTADFSEIDSNYDVGEEVVTDNDNKTYNIVYTILVYNIRCDSFYDINITATDDFDFSDSETENVELDNVALNVTVNLLTTTVTAPDLNGTINDSIATLSLVVDGETYTPTNNGDDTWSLTNVNELEAGTYDVNICATDSIGNVVCDNSVNELVIEEVIEDLTCPNGYVLVPNDLTYNTGDFCVMQFEAKVDQNSDGIGDSNSFCQYDSYHVWGNDTNGCSYTEPGRSVISTIEGYPLAYISWINAKAACESIGTGYHLITNDEWMTIARNIESQGENWSTGTVGLGYIPRGNSGCNWAIDGTTVLIGIHQRNLILSNGNEINDLVGNVAEWVDKTITRGNLPQPQPYNSSLEYDDILSYGSLNRDAYDFAIGKDYNSDNSIGVLNNNYLAGSLHVVPFVRGGDWWKEAGAGILTLSLYFDCPVIQYGFRCSVGS